MTPATYRAIIAQLGLSQEAAGVWLAHGKRTGQEWARESGKGPPELVAKVLRLMVRLGLDKDELR